MDKTPKTKSLRFVRSNGKASSEESTLTKSDTSTPVKGIKKPRIWENDVLCSQENAEVDVTWDWDSPKNIKPKILHVHKKDIHESPKITVKKPSQVDHIKNFEKLKEELQALRNELARVDEDCLPLSPVDEQSVREESAKDCSEIESFIEEQYLHIENQENEHCITTEPLLNNNQKVDDMLNDSFDEQLILCSQMLEDNLIKSETLNLKPESKNFLEVHKSENQKNINSAILKIDFNTISKLDSPHGIVKRDLKPLESDKSADDSFDTVMKEFKDEDIDILTQCTNMNSSFVPRKFQDSPKSNTSFKRTCSDANVQYVPRCNEVLKVAKFSFHRTHSFESAATSKNDNLPKHVIEEIDRKRREALARLKDKKEKEKQLAAYHESYSNISPMKCSPEEIEQKRLQAKAIREAKQMKTIEKNRQEALKRLEANRMKRLGLKKNTSKP